jgi:competence protein ComGC|tara:strand:- start:593 stop:895 length:303 start_codon:yes stop_codon:yes gene_type:complete
MKAKIIIILFSVLLMVSGCQTIKKKSDEVAEKENERFGQFVGKQITELKMELGSPTEDYINEIGNETLVYKTKKYGIPCERKFEINTGGTIVGFTSSGCI